MQQWNNRSILPVDLLPRDDVDTLFQVAQKMKYIVQEQPNSLCKGKVLCDISFATSTQPPSPFYAPMLNLGGSVKSIHAMPLAKEGEILQDTVYRLAKNSDIIVLRHSERKCAKQLSSCALMPLINLNDDIGEHYIQALIDIFTILHEKKTIDGLVITMMGDLKNRKVFHFFALLLALYDVKLNYVSQIDLQMPNKIKKRIQKNGIIQKEFTQFKNVIDKTDVLYISHVQKNFKYPIPIIDPLPHFKEISSIANRNLDEITKDLYASHFQQNKYGLHVRMSLLTFMLNVFVPILEKEIDINPNIDVIRVIRVMKEYRNIRVIEVNRVNRAKTSKITPSKKQIHWTYALLSYFYMLLSVSTAVCLISILFHI